MIKKCTPKFVLELNDYILNGKMKSLEIVKRDDSYFADYTVSKTVEDIDTSTKIHASNIITQFQVMLTLGKVDDFSMFYEQAESKCVVSQSYNISTQEVTREVKLDSLREQLDTIKTIIEDVDIEDTEVKGLHEKVVTRGSGKGAQKKPGSTTYPNAKLISIIEKVIKELK